jgi:methionyl-tRNA synthetase
VPLGLDGDFTYEALIGRYNADLANDLGNLLNRTLTMTGKFCDGLIPARSDEPAGGAESPHAELDRTAAQAIAEAGTYFDDWAPSRALEAIWALVRAGNRYVDACQPWKLGKRDDPQARAELDHCMRTAMEALACAARLMAPVLPGKAAALLAQLGVSTQRAGELIGSWPTPERFGRELETGTAVARGEVLFPRIDKDRQAALMNKWLPAADTPAKPEQGKSDKGKSKRKRKDKPAEGGTVPFADVARLDLRVAEVRTAEAIPKTSKLLRLTVDVGPLGTRQVVAGIAGRYKPEEVVGKRVILVANLAPATIRGVESQGMLLAAGDDDILALSTVDETVPNGTRVR